MRKQQLPSVLCLTLTLFVLSCKKNEAPPANGGSTGSTGNTTTPTDSIVVNLNYQISISRIYEVIISEPGGKILLDTQTVSNTPVKATLHTGQPLLDLTLINKISDSNLSIYTYTGVNPANWHNLVLSMYYDNGSEGNNTPATITYINYPNESPLNFMFANPQLITYTSGYSNNTLSVQYEMAAGKYDYLLLPQEGLYNLHIPTSARDTVDLTKMDTATKLSYSLTAGYTYGYALLVGTLDTIDKTKSLALSGPALNFPPGIQLELPSIPFEKYSGEVDASLSSTEAGVYYYYGDSLQLNIPYFAAGSYTMSSIDTTVVKPVFSITPAPTRYMSEWIVNANTVFDIYSSPDSVEHPSALINSIASQSKLLKGIPVNSLKLFRFGYFNTDNMSYSAYFQKASNYPSGSDQPIQKEISYYKYY
jgi:hypothetical protein